jgi:ABC-type transport system involved in multi-copper enzyme maturation permease subunit
MTASAREFLKKYMSFKLVKMAVSLSATILLAFVFRNQAKGILINFLVFYLITIVFENVMVMQLKKKNSH